MFIVQIFIVQIFIAQIFVAQIFVSKYLFPKYLKHSKCLLSKCVQTCGCRRLNLRNLQKFQQKSRFAPICIDLEFFHDVFAQATLTLCVLLSPQSMHRFTPQRAIQCNVPGLVFVCLFCVHTLTLCALLSPQFIATFRCTAACCCISKCVKTSHKA